MRYLVLIAVLLAAPMGAAQEDVRGTALYQAVENGSLSGRNVRTIQRELQRLGYRPGIADGIFGPRTQRAIAQWQTDTGQRVSGLGLAPGEVENLTRAACGGGVLRRMRGTMRNVGGVCY